MADRNGAARDVQPIVRDTQPVAAVEHLHGEGLIQFPEADIVHGQAVAFQQARHRKDRTDAHLVRLAPRHRHPPKGAERRQAPTLRLFRVHDYARGSSVRQLGRVARRDVLPLLDHFAATEDRLQR